MSRNLHRHGPMVVDGVYYWVTHCLDHKHCSMTERQTGYKVMELLGGYANYRQVFSDGHKKEQQEQISLFDGMNFGEYVEVHRKTEGKKW